MAASQLHDEIEIFLKQYYGIVVSSPSSLSNFISENGQLSISKEHDLQKTYTQDFHKYAQIAHKKSIGKVFISSYDVLNNSVCICVLVVGQLVYEDSENVRFVETLNIDPNTKLIMQSIVRILDEEIIYDKVQEESSNSTYIAKKMVYDRTINPYIKDSRKSLCIKDGGKFSLRNIIQDFKIYGIIVGFEKKASDKEAYVEFENFDCMDKIKKDISSLKERGYDIDFSKKHIKKESEKK